MLRGGWRVFRRVGRGRGRGASGHRTVGRAPSPLTSESLQQIGLSSPAPSRRQEECAHKTSALWNSVSGVRLPLRAASRSVRSYINPLLKTIISIPCSSASLSG